MQTQFLSLQVIETLAKIHMVMEYAPHGELFTKITSFGKLPENEAKCNFGQIVSAVAHMVSGAKGLATYHNQPPFPSLLLLSDVRTAVSKHSSDSF